MFLPYQMAGLWQSDKLVCVGIYVAAGLFPYPKARGHTGPIRQRQALQLHVLERTIPIKPTLSGLIFSGGYGKVECDKGLNWFFC